MNSNEVIEWLEDGFTKASISDIPYYSYLIQKLKMDKPVTPNSRNNKTFTCNACGRKLRCPTRKRLYNGHILNRIGDKFCPTCGQAIDWNEFIKE